MIITPEEVEAYQWALQYNSSICSPLFVPATVLRDALRRHIANEMRLEFEVEHRNCINVIEPFRFKSICADHRHDYNLEAWDKAAHEALIGVK